MISPGNALLRSLPSEELERLAPYLRKVETTAGQTIFGTGEPVSHLWFFESGAATRLVQLNSGETVEAGTVGNDGVAGVSVALDGRTAFGQCTVHIPGSALLMSADDFDQHVRASASPLLFTLMRYASLCMGVLGQLTACHCLHHVEQRLTRCLLTLDDHSAGGCIQITHDTLAGFLGVHRPSVTYALQTIADTGAITLQRRRIAIVNRETLLPMSCECYSTIRGVTKRGLEGIAQRFAG